MLKLSVRTVRNAIHFPYKTHWVFKNEKKTDLIWQRTHLVHKCGYFPFSCSGYLKGSLCTVCKYFQNPSFISLFQVYLCADVTLSRTVSVRYWYSGTRWIKGRESKFAACSERDQVWRPMLFHCRTLILFVALDWLGLVVTLFISPIIWYNTQQWPDFQTGLVSTRSTEYSNIYIE